MAAEKLQESGTESSIGVRRPEDTIAFLAGNRRIKHTEVDKG